MTTNKRLFHVTAEDFKKIPGSPIAYWLSNKAIRIFAESTLLSAIADVRHGLSTGKNEAVVRRWYEVAFSEIGFNYACRNDALASGRKWFPYNKGGDFRRWYGNAEYVLRYDNYGNALMASFSGHRHDGKDRFFQEGVTWTFISSSSFSARYTPAGYVFDVSGSSMFLDNPKFLVAFLCSNLCYALLKALNPTINFQVGNLKSLPAFCDKLDKVSCDIEIRSAKLIEFAKTDWDSYEISWDFLSNPLIKEYQSGRWTKQTPLWIIYDSVRRKWTKDCEKMLQLETENNRIFIEAYGLQDELTPDVPWNEITLTCNPWYRYGKTIDRSDVSLDGKEGRKVAVITGLHGLFDCSSDGVTTTEPYLASSGGFPYSEELETRLLQDTIKELLSYAVGCMMGRYSPEKPGLILADQGSTLDDYLNIMGNRDAKLASGESYSETTTSLVAEPYSINECCGFQYHQIIDFDGVLPILDEEWFADDIVTQFRKFVSFIFGEENLTANLGFIENVLGKDIRKYFVKDFYKDHVQRYRKRPIYWLFSSPKGSFNALIYLHRYTPDTVSIVLNEYLRELMTKIRTRIEHLERENNRADLGNAEKARNLKKIDKYTAQLTELEDYERDILFPLAQQKIAIDLDDGVKVNYIKFGPALKKISGLEAKEE